MACPAVGKPGILRRVTLRRRLTLLAKLQGSSYIQKTCLDMLEATLTIGPSRFELRRRDKIPITRKMTNNAIKAKKAAAKYAAVFSLFFCLKALASTEGVNAFGAAEAEAEAALLVALAVEEEDVIEAKAAEAEVEAA